VRLLSQFAVMTNIDETIECLRHWIDGCGIPLKRLELDAGLSGRTLTLPKRYSHPEWCPTLETIRKLQAHRAKIEPKNNGKAA